MFRQAALVAVVNFPACPVAVCRCQQAIGLFRGAPTRQHDAKAPVASDSQRRGVQDAPASLAGHGLGIFKQMPA